MPIWTMSEGSTKASQIDGFMTSNDSSFLLSPKNIEKSQSKNIHADTDTLSML